MNTNNVSQDIVHQLHIKLYTFCYKDIFYYYYKNIMNFLWILLSLFSANIKTTLYL